MNPTQAQSPTGLPSDSPVPLESVLCTEELNRRPSRPPDYQTENRALTALAKALADSPRTILQTLADTILEVFQADSAGMSLLTTHDGGKRFYWPAIAGAWKPHVGGGTPREFGPCGDVLDRNAPLLFRHFERRYAYLLPATPAAEEALLIPFYVNGKAVGTIWAMAHDDRRRFDAEDLRQLESLGRFASAAYQAVHIRQSEDSRHAALNLMEDAVQAQRLAENLNRELRSEVTEHQLAEALLQHQKEALEILTGSGSLLEVLDVLARAVESQSHEVMMAAIHLLNPAGTHFASVVAPSLPAAYLEATKGMEIATRSGPCCDAILSGESVSVSDVTREPRYPRFAEFAALCGIRAGWSTPILSPQGKVVGTFAVYYREPREPSARDRQMMAFITATVALAIEHKQAEEALRDSEERFRMLADNMVQLAWTCDSFGNVTWYNQRWLDYTGLSFEEMKGWEWSKVQHPDHLERVVARVQRSAETGEPWEDTFPLRDKDGRYRWFLSRAVPIRDEEGNVVRWFGTNTDVTEQRELENQIKQQAEQLADESRRKDEFLAMLSHELRNPLAPIRSAVHLLRLQERGSENRIQQEAREIIERQVGNLTKLVSDLLEVSRVVSGRIRLDQQTVDLNQVVQHATETIKPLIEQRRHELVLNLCDEPIWVNVDATRIEEVCVNLLNNAAKYTEEGGRIEVHIEHSEGGNNVQVGVRDNGMGIDQELLPRIFDLFTQADRSLARSAGGLGIGLSLARRLVDLHGGTIEAHSPPRDRPGEGGSEFIVKLPLTHAPEMPQPVEPDAETAPQQDGTRVLVVDDNIDQVTMLSNALRHRGYSVQSAYTGPDGLKVALQWRPDIVLLDIGLPGLDGYEIARRLRSDPYTKTVRLIALTGYARDTDIALARAAGFDAHLAKPLAFGELEKLLAPPQQQQTHD